LEVNVRILQLSVIREKAIVLFGPPPAEFIDPVSKSEIVRAAHAVLLEWWQPQLTDRSRLESPEYQVYAVLTMCRSIYSMSTGMIVSKETAGRWALEHMGQYWHDLILSSLLWKRDQPFERLKDVLAFIQVTIDTPSDGQ
jgi:hypothetical protein